MAKGQIPSQALRKTDSASALIVQCLIVQETEMKSSPHFQPPSTLPLRLHDHEDLHPPSKVIVAH